MDNNEENKRCKKFHFTKKKEKSASQIDKTMRKTKTNNGDLKDMYIRIVSDKVSCKCSFYPVEKIKKLVEQLIIYSLKSYNKFSSKYTLVIF